jgi:lysozyme
MNTLNDQTLALIERAEGFVDHWYPDPATGAEPMTCCWGHTDAAGAPHYKDAPKRKFTRQEGEQILRNDLKKTCATVASAVKKPINDNQFGALVSFTFNLGAGNFLKSTLLKKVNAGDFAGASLEFAKWNKAAGQVMAGLTKRRAAEAALFSKP